MRLGRLAGAALIAGAATAFVVALLLPRPRPAGDLTSFDAPDPGGRVPEPVRQVDVRVAEHSAQPEAQQGAQQGAQQAVQERPAVR